MKTNENSDKKGYVYLLGDFGKEFMFKIGVTRGTIERRIKKLQTGNSSELYIVDYFQTEHPFFIEKWMHIKYSNKKILNEWFELTMEDMKNSYKETSAVEKKGLFGRIRAERNRKNQMNKESEKTNE